MEEVEELIKLRQEIDKILEELEKSENFEELRKLSPEEVENRIKENQLKL